MFTTPATLSLAVLYHFLSCHMLAPHCSAWLWHNSHTHLCGLVSGPCCAWSLATNSILSFLFILMEPPLRSQSRKHLLYPVLLRRYFLSAYNCPFNLAYVNSLRAGTCPIIPVTRDHHDSLTTQGLNVCGPALSHLLTLSMEDVSTFRVEHPHNHLLTADTHILISGL